MLDQIDYKNVSHKARLKKCLAVMLLSSILWLNSASYVGARESPQHQQHILSRLSFGVTSSEIEQVNRLGIEAYIQSQLKPESIPESPRLENYLASLSPINRRALELQQEDIALRQKTRETELSPKQEQRIRQDIGEFNAEVLKDSVDAHLARAIYSNRQLQEVMVDFWFNHFNVHAHKGSIKLWVNDYENQIRTHALGNFYDLLQATAKHPAMLIYLDNRNNTAPESPAGKRSKKGLNENYARELMELHTLGVDGGYSQDDVIELARILTGWGLDLGGKKGETGFFFYDNRHDQREKFFLGRKIAPNGIKEGEQALNILANHHATAHFISYKLAQYFVADQPPESLVNNLTKKFIDSRGNIRLVMDTLIHSQEFNDPQYYGQKFKTPYQYVTSLVRLSEIKEPDLRRIPGMLHQLSMPIYLCSTPDGYENTQSAWLNPQAMLQRTSWATAIANGILDKKSPVEIQRLEQNLGIISPHTKEVAAKTPAHLRAALMMGSPEAMYR